MSGWNLQKKRYVPARSGARKVRDPPAGTLTLKAPPTEVTVWGAVSAFTTRILAPGRTERGTVKVKPLMWMEGVACRALGAIAVTT